MDKQVIIREYKAADKKRFFELSEEFSQFFVPLNKWGRKQIDPSTSIHFTNKMFRSVKRNNGKVFVAVLDGVLIGFAGFYLRDQTIEEKLEFLPMKFGHIDVLFISKEYRNSNIGKQLIEKAHIYFREKNCTHSELEVFAPNTKAHGFYLKNGYVDKNIQMLKTL